MNDLDKELDEILTAFYKKTLRVDGNTPNARAEAKAKIQALITRARIDGMRQAQSRVLRRTEIPKDARNPTRDAIVILGEEIAGFIEDDIAQLKGESKDE